MLRIPATLPGIILNDKTGHSCMFLFHVLYPAAVRLRRSRSQAPSFHVCLTLPGFLYDMSDRIIHKLRTVSAQSAGEVRNRMSGSFFRSSAGRVQRVRRTEPASCGIRHPFSPVMTIPRVMYFWQRINRIRTGIIAMMEPAMIRSYLAVKVLRNAASPS